VVHVDATHLITNLTAVLPDCVMLEQQCGSAALAADLLLLTTTSHALYGEQQPQGMQLGGACLGCVSLYSSKSVSSSTAAGTFLCALAPQ
jgi:hypothetical protein